MILIDMEMPERCTKCPFVNIVIIPPKMDIHCQLTHQRFGLESVEMNKRHKDCPLHDIKEQLDLNNDRDCGNCIHHKGNYCTSWDCNFEKRV